MFAQVADKSIYLEKFVDELKKEWPENRTLNLVFHGHSVPTGYVQTPVINTLDSYSHLVLKIIKEACPCASS